MPLSAAAALQRAPRQLQLQLQLRTELWVCADGCTWRRQVAVVPYLSDAIVRNAKAAQALLDRPPISDLVE